MANAPVRHRSTERVHSNVRVPSFGECVAYAMRKSLRPTLSECITAVLFAVASGIVAYYKQPDPAKREVTLPIALLSIAFGTVLVWAARFIAALWLAPAHLMREDMGHLQTAYADLLNERDGLRGTVQEMEQAKDARLFEIKHLWGWGQALLDESQTGNVDGYGFMQRVQQLRTDVLTALYRQFDAADAKQFADVAPVKEGAQGRSEVRWIEESREYLTRLLDVLKQIQARYERRTP
jgi:hypothetical protein